MLIYTPERTKKLESRVKRGITAACLTAACALIASIIICLNTNTANSDIMMYAVIALSAVSGWIVIGIYSCVIKPSGAEVSHARGLERAEETQERGVILSLSKPFHIPKSIDIVKVRVESEGTEKTLNLIASRKALLPVIGTECMFTLRRGYITEVTVCEK